MSALKVKQGINPVLIALLFCVISYSLSNAFPVRTVSNILSLGAIELYFFYLVVVFDMQHSKKRMMCTILTISMACLTTPYAVITWLYVNTNVNLIDSIHNLMFNSYGNFSAAVFTMLMTVSILPRKLSDVVSSIFGVDRIVNSISRRFKVRFEKANGGIR